MSNAAAFAPTAREPGVWESFRFAPPGSEDRPQVLLELPHGATEQEHFESLRARLRGGLPADLEAFFWVNTDIGSPEVAARLAASLAQPRGGAPAFAVEVLRCLIPRTFVDTNRVLAAEVAGGMTSGLHSYVEDPADRRLLSELHGRYTARAEAAYQEVCGRGGLALTLHTYAPRSVEVSVDEDIVRALRAAYVPQVYRRWPRRPPVDLITRDATNRDLSPPGLAELVRTVYARRGITVESNHTYHLHPATQGFLHAERYPGRVLCLELNRGRLAAPFTPFLPSPISARKVSGMARPLAEALRQWLGRTSPTSG